MNSRVRQLAYGGTVIKLEKTDNMEQIVEKVVQVQPSKRQIEWQALEFTAFIHFGLNTYTNKEWGDGTESPTLFNPVDFDARQWVRGMEDAQMKGIILTCKHHDGFCLWPSKYTEYSVKNSPWKNGQGDIVKEVSDACKEFGIKFGIYLSPWDRHESSYGDSDRYNEYYRNQLTELLTQYGEIFEVWLDGACAEGPNGKKQVYDWRSYYELVRKLQPQATITGMGPDARWCGNEAGIGRVNEWSVVPVPGMEEKEAHESDQTAIAYPKHNYTLATTQDLGSRPTLAQHAKDGDQVCWYPSQVDVSIRPSWFYHKSEDNQVKSLKHMMKIYYESVGGNAQLLLNLPPTSEGLIHTNDVNRLKEVGQVIKRTFNQDLLEGASQVITNQGNTQIITLTPKEAIIFNTLMLQEDIQQGQRVETFVVEIERDGVWEQVAAGTVIGYKKLIKLDEEMSFTANKVRIHITQSRAVPDIYKVGAFKAPSIIEDLEINRSLEGVVSIKAPLEGEIYYTLNGEEPTDKSIPYTGPFELYYGGTVKAVTYYKEENLDLYIPENKVISSTFNVIQNKWQIVKSLGHTVGGFEQEKAIDGRLDTYLKSERVPYVLDIDMGEQLEMTGFNYLPTTWGADFEYNVFKYSFYVSDNGIDWKVVRLDDSFDNIYHNPILQVVELDDAIKTRYIRFEALESRREQEGVVIRNLGVYAKKV